MASLLLRLKKFFTNSIESETPLRETIDDFIEDSTQQVIEPDEREILGNVLDLRNLTASDVMMPRADIIAAPISISGDELLSLFVKMRLTRIPIYQDTLDNIVGMMHVKEILAWKHRREPFKIHSLMKEILFVSPSMRTLNLLLQMKETGKRLAVVVDEYGGVDGLVTFGQLIHEVIGDIKENQLPLSLQKDGSIIVDARTKLCDLEKVLGIKITDEDNDEIDTLGGLVIFLAGYVPERGVQIVHPLGFKFEILESNPRCVSLVAIYP